MWLTLEKEWYGNVEERNIIEYTRFWILGFGHIVKNDKTRGGAVGGEQQWCALLRKKLKDT